MKPTARQPDSARLLGSFWAESSFRSGLVLAAIGIVGLFATIAYAQATKPAIQPATQPTNLSATASPSPTDAPPANQSRRLISPYQAGLIVACGFASLVGFGMLSFGMLRAAWSVRDYQVVKDWSPPEDR